MNKELLPCPFCDGEAESLDLFPRVLVRCKDCGANTGFYFHLTNAVDSWNTRSYQLDTAEDVEFLSELWDYIKFCRNASVKDIRQIHDRARDLIAYYKKSCKKNLQVSRSDFETLEKAYHNALDAYHDVAEQLEDLKARNRK